MDTKDPWRLLQKEFDPFKERVVESLLSLSNGFIGSRNTLEEYYSFSVPVTNVAGIYQPMPDKSYNGIANIADWARICVFLDDTPITLENSRIIEHTRSLDLEKGISIREWISQDEMKRITCIRIVKFISLADKHLAYKRISVKPVNYSGKLKVISGIDGKTAATGVSFPPDEEVLAKMHIPGNGSVVAMIQKSISDDPSVKRLLLQDEKMKAEVWEWYAELEKERTIESIVAVFSSIEDGDPYLSALNFSNAVNADVFRNCMQDHILSWKEHWERAAISITPAREEQQWINFAVYHLLSTAEFSGNYNSIGARGLSGIAYHGHVFWDTEIYLMPFYMFNDPSIARALLMYRYNTLDGARENARRGGDKGACFAWESTDSGLEMTPVEIIHPYGMVIPVYTGLYEIHITPDIAYAVWQYWQVTRDEEFFVNYGSEIIIECARFCEAEFHEGDDGLFHIDHVVGPDEYHDRVDDNAYTNLMAAYNLEIAVKVCLFLNEKHAQHYSRLKEKIGLQDEEIERWDEISERVYTGFNEEKGLYEQFMGFFGLKTVNIEAYEPRTMPMDVLLGIEETRQSQVIKQPDVLMLLFLLYNRFPAEVIKKNYEYYAPRTSHGSSLSPSIHCVMAARLQRMDEAYAYLRQNALIDLDDNMGNASGGIHIAAVGGTWMCMVMGFAGMQIFDEGLLFDPHLPPGWEELVVPLQWRGQQLEVWIGQNLMNIKITGDSGAMISAGPYNWRQLSPGMIYTCRKEAGWEWIN